MKKVLFLGFAAMFFAACSSNNNEVVATEEQEVAQVSEGAETFSVDVASSTLNWKGTKKGGSSHVGTINLTEGSLSIENGNITAGNFVIDMNSIANTDLPVEGDYNQTKLVGHLKSNDFFATEEFPTATFEVSSVSAAEANELGNTHMISGNFTLRGITKNISFPAKVEITENGITADAVVSINRLDWGVTFDQQGIQNFLDGIVKKGKDDFVNNAIELTLKIVAKK